MNENNINKPTQEQIMNCKIISLNNKIEELKTQDARTQVNIAKIRAVLSSIDTQLHNLSKDNNISLHDLSEQTDKNTSSIEELTIKLRAITEHFDNKLEKLNKNTPCTPPQETIDHGQVKAEERSVLKHQLMICIEEFLGKYTKGEFKIEYSPATFKPEKNVNWVDWEKSIATSQDLRMCVIDLYVHSPVLAGYIWVDTKEYDIIKIFFKQKRNENEINLKFGNSLEEIDN
jgi:hypothetical protein